MRFASSRASPVLLLIADFIFFVFNCFILNYITKIWLKDSTMQNIVHEDAYLLYKRQKSGFEWQTQKTRGFFIFNPLRFIFAGTE